MDCIGKSSQPDKKNQCGGMPESVNEEWKAECGRTWRNGTRDGSGNTENNGCGVTSRFFV